MSNRLIKLYSNSPSKLMESVNIKTIAQQLNLSIATVSKALRDSYDISAATKEKVVTLANRLNYQPNPHASSLRKHNSKTIAVIIPEIANNYFTLAINGIESAAQEKGYHVMIYLTHEDMQREVALVRTLYNGRADGVLISVSGTTTNYAHLHDLKQRGMPMVFFDRVCDDFDTLKVTTDDYESAYLATKHLIEQGCKRIAHFAISRNLSIGNQRTRGYMEALQDQGLPMDESLILGCHSNDQDIDTMLQLFRDKKPDGVFAAVERYAIACYEVCQRMHLRIPTDVKIISFSNLQTAAFLNPGLSTITQPAYEMGRQAAGMLLKSLEKKSFVLKDEHMVIQSVLTRRASTSTSA